MNSPHVNLMKRELFKIFSADQTEAFVGQNPET